MGDGGRGSIPDGCGFQWIACYDMRLAARLPASRQWYVDAIRFLLYHIDRKGADHMEAANMWDFPVMEGVSFENANHVHPLMQGRVEKLLRGISGDQNIRRAILFGSSLEFRCSSTSDIDLYIEKYDPEKKLDSLPDIDCELDIITNLRPDNKLYQRIKETGLLLLER